MAHGFILIALAMIGFCDAYLIPPVMRGDYRWAKAKAGSQANFAEGDADSYTWKRAKKFVEPKPDAAATTDDGACYIVDEKESPDPSKNW